MDAFNDEDTQRTGTANSIDSGLTSLENGTATDDFGRKILEHAKDERRLYNALKNKQPFRKARPNTRVALTLENLERNQGTPPLNSTQKDVAGGNGYSRNDSPASSERSDPPLNIPREWGRKGRQGTEWLTRIKTADELVDDPNWHSGDKIIPYKPSLTGDGSPRSVDWVAAAADIPVPSVEDTPSSRGKPRNSSSPASLRKRQSSIDQIREWEMSEDFTVGSLLTSTPAMPARNRALDEIRQREIESLSKRNLASTRLDQIREQSPESAKRPMTSRSLPENDAADVTSRAEDFSMATLSGYADDRRRSTQGVFEAIKNSPTTSKLQHKGSSESLRSTKTTLPPSVTLAERMSNLNKSTNNSKPIPQRHHSTELISTQLKSSASKATKDVTPKRPEHERTDSRELLRQLARVTSASPSPGRITDATARKQEEKKPSPLSSKTSNGNLRVDNLSQAENDKAAPEPVVTESPEDKFLHVQPSDNDTINPNTLRQAEPTVMKTPRVTGAWVDTPGTRKTPRYFIPNLKPASLVPWNPFRSKSKADPPPGPADIEHKLVNELREPIQYNQQTIKQPRNPKSALAAILEEARGMSQGQQNNTASGTHIPSSNNLGSNNFGDDTVRSLEEILDPDNADYTNPLDFDPTLLAELRTLQQRSENEASSSNLTSSSMVGEEGRRLTQAERERRQQLLDLVSMDARLKNTQTSIKDAKRGLKRAEARIEASNEAPRPVMPGTYDAQPHVHYTCPNCGYGAAPGMQPIHPWSADWTAFRSRFYYYDSDGVIEFTPLFAKINYFLMWFVLEWALSSNWDRIFYPVPADHGHPPRFPWAIPTLVLRFIYAFVVLPFRDTWRFNLVIGPCEWYLELLRVEWKCRMSWLSSEPKWIMDWYFVHRKELYEQLARSKAAKKTVEKVVETVVQTMSDDEVLR
ncbi:MAG: hypothetical protein M1820_005579 [Bogoriella megaspora]|nr:MAG: hypothetical protein M1820_005579 [Bogoriella megaspora]